MTIDSPVSKLEDRGVATDAHDATEHSLRGLDPGSVADRPPRARMRRRWLLSAVVVAGSVAVILVVSGSVPLSTVLYSGLIGGMLLMHLGGHGHGGHGHGGHGPDAAAPTENRAASDDDDSDSDNSDHGRSARGH